MSQCKEHIHDPDIQWFCKVEERDLGTKELCRTNLDAEPSFSDVLADGQVWICLTGEQHHLTLFSGWKHPDLSVFLEPLHIPLRVLVQRCELPQKTAMELPDEFKGSFPVVHFLICGGLNAQLILPNSRRVSDKLVLNLLWPL